MKKYIPNLLTTYRIIVALLIPVLFFYSGYTTIFILFVIAILSDAIDGVLARKWNVSSTYGKVADAIGDKLLAFSASSTFIVKISKYYIITLVLELIIAIINSIKGIKAGTLKNKNFDVHNSSIYGKIKTWFLFILLFIGLISFKIEFLKIFILPFIIATAIMQLITAIDYSKDLTL